MILATPVFSPSLISKTRSTRLFGSSMIFGIHRDVVAAAALIDLDDALDVGLHVRARQGAARLGLDLRAELLVLGLLLPSNATRSMTGVFDHRDDEATAGLGEMRTSWNRPVA